MLQISGDTYDIRERLKALGCRWDEDSQCWTAPSESARAEGQALADAEPPRKWREYMETLTWQKGSFQGTVFAAGLNACSRGIPIAQAMEEITARMLSAGTTPGAGTIERNVGRAYERAEPPPLRGSHGSAPSGPGGKYVPPERPKKPEFEESVLTRFAAPWREKTDTAWLSDRSALDPSTITPDGFLRALYAPGERVVILDVFASQGQWLWSHEAGFEPSAVDHKKWAEDDRTHANTPPVRPGAPFPAAGPKGIWYLCNPVDGKFREQPEEDKWGRKKWSRRWEPCVTAWRYLALESDDADARDWMGAIVQLPLPIAAIYTSAGRSIHVLVKMDAASKAQFDLWRETTKRTMIPLGADHQCMSAVRLTRLPGCLRCCDKDGKEYAAGPRLQKLLYLDPEANAQPLIERAPIRDSVGPWERWAESLLRTDAEELELTTVDEVERGLRAFPGARTKALLTRLAELRASARPSAPDAATSAGSQRQD